MMRRRVLYIALFMIVVIFCSQGCGRRSFISNRILSNSILRREYEEYTKRITAIHRAIEKKYGTADKEQLQSDDPLGMVFVSDVLRYKNIRPYRLKSTNGAQQLLIRAVESINNGDCDSAFTLSKESVRTDVNYLRSHFLLAGLYERKADLVNMEKEYKYYLQKTLFMRKAVEAKTGLPDIEFKFIKEKFDRYKIPAIEPGVNIFNARYWIIGAICMTLILYPIIVFLVKITK